MSSIELHMQRQTELLEEMRKTLEGLRADFLNRDSARGRLDESCLRAIKSLSEGLQEHADEHLRWMRMSGERHEALMGGLVDVISTRQKPNGATGTVPVIAPTKPTRGDISGSIEVAGARIEGSLTHEHAKAIGMKALRWLIFLLVISAAGAIGWVVNLLQQLARNAK